MSAYQLPIDCPYTLKGFKEMSKLSEETMCFAADIALRGKVVGTASNRGTGGANMVFFKDPADFKVFQAYLKTLPVDATDPDMICTVDEDYFFSVLAKQTANAAFRARESKKWIKRCQTHTVYRVVGDGKGEWRMIQSKVTKKPLDMMKFQLHVASKETVEVVLNELIEQDPFAYERF